MLRAVWASVANLAIAPVQDLLGLGTAARMNHPGTTQGNWEWRLTRLPDGEVQQKLRRMTEIYGRSPP
jgi:4-alpha-glucanotransferase